MTIIQVTWRLQYYKALEDFVEAKFYWPHAAS